MSQNDGDEYDSDRFEDPREDEKGELVVVLS